MYFQISWTAVSSVSHLCGESSSSKTRFEAETALQISDCSQFQQGAIGAHHLPLKAASESRISQRMQQ